MVLGAHGTYFVQIYIQPPWSSMAAAGRQVMNVATAIQQIIRQDNPSTYHEYQDNPSYKSFSILPAV